MQSQTRKFLVHIHVHAWIHPRVDLYVERTNIKRNHRIHDIVLIAFLKTIEHIYNKVPGVNL